jgi:hypothetical protein
MRGDGITCSPTSRQNLTRRKAATKRNLGRAARRAAFAKNENRAKVSQFCRFPAQAWACPWRNPDLPADASAKAATPLPSRSKSRTPPREIHLPTPGCQVIAIGSNAIPQTRDGGDEPSGMGTQRDRFSPSPLFPLRLGGGRMPLSLESYGVILPVPLDGIDPRSDSIASSSVSPWPLPSGNSGENAMNHFPSRTMRAVKMAASSMSVECIFPQHPASSGPAPGKRKPDAPAPTRRTRPHPPPPRPPAPPPAAPPPPAHSPHSKTKMPTTHEAPQIPIPVPSSPANLTPSAGTVQAHKCLNPTHSSIEGESRTMVLPIPTVST